MAEYSEDFNKVRQFVAKVTKFSSQYNSSSWSANTVIGPPRVYPQYGDLHGAWASSDINANQFIEVKYNDKVYVNEINIYETYHAGGTRSVKVRDPSGKWETIYQTKKLECIKKSRIFTPSIQKPNYQVNELRIEVDCTKAGTWVEIDAVELVGTRFNFEVPQMPAQLSGDMGQLVNSDLFSDVQFSVDGRIFHGHKAILVVRSNFFQAMFCDQMRESTTSEPIVLKDVSADAFAIILHFIYTNEIAQNSDCLLLLEIWRVADQFCLEGLKSMTFISLCSTLNVENVVDIYVEAATKLPVIEDLMTAAMQFMRSRMDEIVRQPNFTSLPKDVMVEIIQHMTEKLSLSDSK
ncbi:TD and POZ domain-containing protein 3-like [Ostrea edulis]|uniref:TD and POZ domain-containing protein 3-like n=1 Tax=Ostrea edulis TaxID=37623 RepID=UPI00209614EA|nr:TD and POZ domain-containing protein 3-like [Ostrea edulis]